MLTGGNETTKALSAQPKDETIKDNNLQEVVVTANELKRTKTITKSIVKITTGTKIMEALIHSNERLDDLCRKGYRLIQDPKLFCFGIDAVLLSDYAKGKARRACCGFVYRKRCDSDTS